MEAKKMFNLSAEMIKKQCGAGELQCDSSAPIRNEETLEPCIRGAEKINNDSELKELIRGILLGEK